MSDVTNPDLTRAYQLIEADELDQARTVLDNYLETHRDNADAWWLYAHAVTDPMDAQNALRNVLRLAPDYPGAKALLSESEQILTPTRDNAGITRLASRPVAADDLNRAPDFLDRLDDADDSDFDLDSDVLDFGDNDEFGDDVDEDEDQPTPSRRLQFLLIASLIAVVLVALALVLTNRARNPQPTATTAALASATSPAVIIVPTETATAGSQIETTAEVLPATTDSVDLTLTATETNDTGTAGGNFESVYSAMSAYTVLSDSAGVEQTNLGSTFLISICNDPANGLVTTALNAVETLTAQAAVLEGQAEYIGVRVVDCNRDNLVLRTLAVSLADADAFSDGSLTINQLRAGLKPVAQ